MNRLTRLSAALALAAAAAAPALAAPETYVVDPTHTYPRFSYSHFGYSTQLSRFNKTSGTVVLDAAAKTGAVDITIDTKSVDTGYATFDEHIQAAVACIAHLAHEAGIVPQAAIELATLGETPGLAHKLPSPLVPLE